MKRRLIILDFFLLMLIVTIGIALFVSFQNQHKEVPISSYQEHNISYTDEELAYFEQNVSEKMTVDVSQIKQGDFSTLSGIWRNLPGATEEIELLVSGSSAILNDAPFDLVFTNLNPHNQLPQLQLSKIGNSLNYNIGVYPRGSHVPVLLADGTIEKEGKSDPTNNQYDRIIFGGGGMPAEETKYQVLYRTIEEIA